MQERPWEPEDGAQGSDGAREDEKGSSERVEPASRHKHDGLREWAQEQVEGAQEEWERVKEEAKHPNPKQFTHNLKKMRFLEALAKRFTVSAACEDADVGRKTVYEWRKDDPAFAEAWDIAASKAVERLEESVYERAFREPVLAMFTLKGARPEKWREQYKAEVQASGEFKIRFAPSEEDK